MKIATLLGHLAKRIPPFRGLILERDRLRSFVDQLWVPPGHFYSPLPSLEEVRRREADIWGDTGPTIAGVDLNEAAQLALFAELSAFYQDVPFPRDKIPGTRYFYDNAYFSYSDAIVLFCMLRHARPRRVIEIGSGYSSCVILDTNERFFDGAIACTFIDPEPDRLRGLISASDLDRVSLIERQVQDVDLACFDDLTTGDILFVDSSHVTKVGSDVNHILFAILPRLAGGVLVHFHDIFYPFEYPKEWVYEGMVWNEAYLLRAFLQYNAAFEIRFFTSFLKRFHQSEFARHMPLCLEDKEDNLDPADAPSGSIWLRRVR